MNIKKKIDRQTGYYWVKTSTGQWIIAKWWNNLQWFDTMSTIKEYDQRRGGFLKVDEKQIIKKEKIAKRKRKKVSLPIKNTYYEPTPIKRKRKKRRRK